MKLRLRFTLRILLVLIFVAAIPCWWIALEISQYRMEQTTLNRIRRHAPQTQAYYTNTTLAWLRKFGLKPRWFDRVTDIDVTGIPRGQVTSGDLNLPLDFDDDTFAAICDDLHKFEELTELYFQLTRLSDKSLPALRSFDQLKFINLQQTAASSANVRELEAELPNTKIAFFHELETPRE